MFIDRIIYPITTLGPGKRLAIWTVGCSKRCYHCANPELWDICEDNYVAIGTLCEMIHKYTDNICVDGITITGGDPLEQVQDTITLVKLLSNLTDDIIVYTGYTLFELEQILSPQQMTELKKYISVLIDGRYVDELNDGKTAMIGSTNQKIHFFDSSVYDKYNEYFSRGRSIQNVFYGNKLISVGIHNKEEE